MKKTQKSLIFSVISLVLCFSMLVGSTFAWFTDSVMSASNIIAAGNLDVKMYWSNDMSSWNDIEGENNKVFNYDNWEPGYTEVKYLKIQNNGSLAFKYQLNLLALGEVGKLAEVIDVYYCEAPEQPLANRDLSSLAKREGTLKDLIGGTGTMLEGVLLPAGKTDANYKSGEIIVAIALHMQESAGNEYQKQSVGDGFTVQLLATQYSFETDAFGSDYDENAAADLFPGFQGGSAGIAVTTNDQGATTSEAAVEAGDVSALIPAGVQVAEGAASLGLTVTQKNTSDANIQLGDAEAMRSLDVHIEGVADGNTVPMLITLKGYLTTGMNTGSLKLYHVENGVTVAMTHVANPVNHNEFSYDPATGDVTLALASFSEVAVVADTTNPWDGTTETPYSGSGTEADPYLIASADQLAKFRTDVDNGNSFEGKFVKLNNNIYLSGKLFDPIGWGYVNTAWNSGNADGKVFQGTFDGNGKTIFDLYQSGWDLTNAGTGEAYTYTNCGFGLFAAAADATFKNLTIYGAYVRVECVETGILVGLSQGSCTYENIQIHNSKIANYQRPTGGLIGEVSPMKNEEGEWYGSTNITNVEIGSDVVVGSLWGDFDAPCGGVIGARWDDSNTTTVNMKDVEVGCRMDVYSDVTSAYQWYAYRRAGMLIGNTEQTAENNGHLAAAPFLKCENVKVYYGDWAAYHYCQFTNQDNAWCNNYPWVRVEAGENCDPYSNPRYGQPVVGGVTVSTDNHTCTGEHLMERRFNQLYGGGQGVYGQFEHEGVEVINYRYSITYVNDYQVLAIKYVTESGAVNTANDVAQKLVEDWAKVNIGENKFVFGGWMNAGSTKLELIPADNTKDIVLYPYFNNPYTARFVDQNGNVVAYCFFHKEDTTKLEETRAAAEAALPDLGDEFELEKWEVHITDDYGKTISTTDYTAYAFASSKTDVTVYPVYKFNGDVSLVPMDENGDGDIDYYQVKGFGEKTGEQELVEIPAYVNGKPVTTVNADAFSSYDDLHSVRIPGTITEINSQAFTANQGSSWNPKRDTITMYYEGDPAVWNAEMEKYITNHNYNGMFKPNWDNMMGDGSRVFFLDENGKVINDRYWELNDDYVWVLHEHAYTYEAAKNCSHGEKSHYEYGGGFIGIGASLQQDKFTNYAGSCDCNSCKGATRPDADYWN